MEHISYDRPANWMAPSQCIYSCHIKSLWLRFDFVAQSQWLNLLLGRSICISPKEKQKKLNERRKPKVALNEAKPWFIRAGTQYVCLSKERELSFSLHFDGKLCKAKS